MDRRGFFDQTLLAPIAGLMGRPRKPSGRHERPARAIPAWLASTGLTPARAEEFEARSLPYPASRRALTASLTPLPDSQLGTDRAAHLYRRAGFGGTGAEIAAARLLSAPAAVDALLSNFLLDQAHRPPLPANAGAWLTVPPYLGDDQAIQEAQNLVYVRAWFQMQIHWIRRMSDPTTILRERMLLFWMNHFVIAADKVYFPQMIFRYMDYFRGVAWGNFKQMVKDVTIAPAMLSYLDGADSQADDPNENYARELMELFTLGVTDKNGTASYTEQDIKEIAKTLTGWTIDYEAPAPLPLVAAYHEYNHNNTLKSPFGATPANYGLKSGNPALPDVIDLLFQQRGNQIAWFICEKLYRYFVYQRTDGAVERAVIDDLAVTLQASNWELRPVLSALLSSTHFHDPANVGVQIKSPAEYLVGLVRGMELPLDESIGGTLDYICYYQGMDLLFPPNVKGWIGYRRWLSTTTLPLRDTVVATNLAVGGQVGDTFDDDQGNHFEPLLLTDAALILWAKKLPAYHGGFISFANQMIGALCANPPSQRVIDNILAKVTDHTYEWPTLPDADRVSTLRTVLNEILLLAEYQLA